MDKNDVMFPTHVHQCVPHRILTLPSAGENPADLGQMERCDDIPSNFREIPFRNGEENFIDQRGALKGLEGMNKDRESGQRQVLLGKSAPHAFSCSARRNDRNRLHDDDLGKWSGDCSSPDPCTVTALHCPRTTSCPTGPLSAQKRSSVRQWFAEHSSPSPPPSSPDVFARCPR